MRHLALLCYGLLITLLTWCQDSVLSKADYPKIISPSPEAAALGKYGDVPVSLFSGLPTITIPVYTLKNGDISVPIGLSYNAGGIRVDDIATNVGLGWALNAGGIITNSVHGIPDGVNDAVYPTASFNPNTLNHNATIDGQITSDYEFAMDAITYNRDTEKDIYYYNFLGNSGKFFFDRSGATRLIPANPAIKIGYYDNAHPNQGYKITDDKGYQYYFTTAETSGASSVCTVGHDSPKEYTDNFSNSFYLSKIVSPDNRQVLLQYESYSYVVEKSYDEVQYTQQRIVNGCSDISTVNNRECKRVETYSAQRIKHITCSENNVDVSFTYATAYRQDLTYNSDSAGHYLQAIDVYTNSHLIKDWQFTYGYFSTGTTPRLKLLTAKEDDQPAYKFYYNETHDLPARLSFSQDHWGFSNGKSNSTFIPPIPAINKADGADRSPDSSYMKSGVLNKMRYPTGGYTLFDYEPHTDSVTEAITTYVNDTASAAVVANVGSGNAYATFHLPTGAADVSLSWSFTSVNYDETFNGYIVDSANNSTVYRTLTGSGSENIFPTDGITNMPFDHAYKIIIERPASGDAGNILITWKAPVTATVTNNQKIVFGGLRIKSVKNYDSSDSLTGAKYYSYNKLDKPRVSTVVLPPVPVLTYNDIYEGLNNVTSSPTSTPCGYDVSSASTIPALGNNLDDAIGYSQVVEISQDSGMGRTIYKYSTNPADIGITGGIGSGNIEWCKGLLLEKTEQLFDKGSLTFQTIHKTDNYYQSSYTSNCFPYSDSCAPNQAIMENMRIKYVEPEITLPNGSGFGASGVYPAIFSVEKYLTISAPVLSQRTEDTTYNNGLIYSTTKANYYTDNTHLDPTSTEMYDSRGKLIKVQYKYPHDFAGTAVYDSMIARNIVSPIVEKKTYQDSVLLAQVKHNYALWQGNSLTKPVTVQTAQSGHSLQTELTFANYDVRGNVLAYTGRNGVSMCYIYGYDTTYPIAEVKNSDTASIAYTSFEADGGGKWVIASLARDTVTAAITGSRSYKLDSGNISKSGLTSGHIYIVCYWSRNGTKTITGGSGSSRTGRTVNGWTYYEHTITASSSTITLSGTGSIDELRLYPPYAQMTTYTYDPLTGMTSMSDTNGEIIYYQYDSFKRLQFVKDYNGNIIKNYKYNYDNSIGN